MRTSHPTARPAARPTALARVLPALLLLAPLAGASLALGSCSSTRTDAPAALGVPVRVRVTSYRSGQAFELVNETHTDRVELYSSKRTSAETKVQTDEVMDELLAQMRRSGFFDAAEPGLAPAASVAGLTRAIEVETPEGSWHLLMGTGTEPREQEVFETCFAGFLDLYNATYQLQSVEPTRAGIQPQGSR